MNFTPNFMPALFDLLQNAGLAELTTSQDELDAFITAYSAAFDTICQQKPDTPQYDLLLGFMTKTYLEKREYLQTQAESMKNMRQVFSATVGKEHAEKFKSKEPELLQCIASIWFMVQGYMRIDYSYAYEHADEVAQCLSEQYLGEQDLSKPSHHVEDIRSEFMRLYYVGIGYSQQKATKSFISTLTQPLKNWFKRD